MIDVYQVAIQLDVEVLARLDGRVCDGCGRRVAYTCEESAGGEVDERVRGAGIIAWSFVDAHEACEVRLYPGWDLIVCLVRGGR